MGTEEDIRKELTAAGVPVTESGISYLTGERNKKLLTRVSQLQNLINAKEDYIDNRGCDPNPNWDVMPRDVNRRNVFSEVESGNFGSGEATHFLKCLDEITDRVVPKIRPKKDRKAGK